MRWAYIVLLEHNIGPPHFINKGCGNLMVTGGDTADSTFTIDVVNQDSHATNYQHTDDLSKKLTVYY